MTYCVGILVQEGLVMVADTRTNAGIDHISTFRKLHQFEEEGRYSLLLCTSGNLSITQSVMTFVTEGIINPETGKIDKITEQPSLFHAAQLVGRAMREVYRIDGSNLEQMAGGFEASILIGGQIAGDAMQLYHIYSAGNFISVTPETPFMQIGEHKYGKPILDRLIKFDSDIYDSLKTALISMDSTMRSNLSVGLPIDIAILRRDVLQCEVSRRIDQDDAYFLDVRKRWGEALKEAQQSIPLPPYHEETEPAA